MKVLLIVVTAICSCILMPYTAKAQTVNWDTLPYIQQADFKLAQLNKSLITTNILYDRVMPIADIERFKAQESFTDTSSPRHWVQAYYELYNSAYNNSTWLTPDELNTSTAESPNVVMKTNPFSVTPESTNLQQENPLLYGSTK